MNAISVAALQTWKLNDAEASITDGVRTFQYAGHRALEEGLEVSFTPSLDSRTDGELGQTLRMTLRYPSTPAIQLVLAQDERDEVAVNDQRGPGRFPLFGSGLPGAFRPREGQRLYRIREIEVDGLRLSLRPMPQSAEEIRVLKPEFSVEENSTRS